MTTSLPNSVRKASGAAAARPSCMWLSGSSPFQSKRTCSPFLVCQILQGEPGTLHDGAKQPPAPLGDASVAWSLSQGSARKFVSNKRASPVTSRSSSSRAPFSRHRRLGGQSGGCSVGHVKAGDCFSSKSEGECPPPRWRRNRVQLRPSQKSAS